MRHVRTRTAAVVAVVSLLAAAPPAGAAGVGESRGGPLQPGPPAVAAEAVPGALLVTTDSPRALAAVLDRAPRAVALAGAATHAVDVLGDAVGRVAVTVGAEEAAARALAALPGVRAVERDGFFYPARMPDDAWYPRQWAHAQTGVEGAWDRSTGSRAVRAAVIDTGMRGDHPDLRPNLEQQVDVSTGRLAGEPRVGVDNDSCGVGHGTWVGGILGAVGNNARDVAGVAWEISIIDIAVNSTLPGAHCEAIPFSAVVAGIDYAVGNAYGPVDVVNMSLGAYTGSCSTALQSAINRARAAGVVLVAAAGNGELDPATAGQPAFPASCAGVISVAATARTETRATYSTTNALVDLAAPGGDYAIGGLDGMVLTLNHVPEIGTMRRVQGTSFSAPYVAGVAALLRAVRPELSPDAVRDAMLQTARDLGLPGRDPEYGHGLVQPSAALASVSAAPSPVPQPAEPLPPPPPPADDPDPQPDPEPEPEDEFARTPPAESSVQRVAPRDGPPTTAVTQAVAVSEATFAPAAARYAVLAREDDFADALSGSSLAYGLAPILFAAPDGPLATATRAELERALPRGATVYLVGGPAALGPEVAAEVRALGFEPQRLAGGAREDTATRVATETLRRVEEAGNGVPDGVLLATRGNWPDAVAAGSLGAMFGMPILLTAPDQLHPSTAAWLREHRPGRVTVVGGTGVVSAAVAQAAAEAAAAPVNRLAGPTRDTTAVAVAEEAVRLLNGMHDGPRHAIAVNLRRDDGFAHVLSASVIAGFTSGVFVPVEAADGSVLPESAQEFVRAALGDDRTLGVLAGGRDVVADAVGERLEELLAEARKS